MEPTSPPKHAASLGERLNRRIEEDASAVVSAMERQLDALAQRSSSALRSSLHTAIADTESQLQRLRRLSWSLWAWTLLSGIVLGIVIGGLSLYAWWKWEHLHRLEVERAKIEAQIQSLPPPFQVKQIDGTWYLIAPQIDPSTLIYNGRDGEKEDAVKLIP